MKMAIEPKIVYVSNLIRGVYALAFRVTKTQADCSHLKHYISLR